MISLISELNNKFVEFTTQALENGILSERERAIAILVTAITLEDTNAVKQAIVTAKQMGVSNEEIGYLSAIVIALRGQKIASLGLVTPTVKSPNSQSNCCR